jgi:energy-coupling factor transporter ATP-binding protein EcfA2
VDRIIEMLRLGKCADTPIRLVSGGERKRVNIGSELLTDPSIIMLDEPTSGLDSSSASALLSILIDLARKGGKTVVTSIHQPNSSAFRKFDRLMLLADGCTVYYGTPMDSLHYLGKLGFDCPAGYNAADHWMDLLVEDSAFDGGTMHSRKSSVLDSKSTEKEQPKDQAPPNLGVMRRKSSILNLKSQKMNRRASSQILLSKARAVAINSDTPKACLIEAWDNDGTAEALEKEENKGFTDEIETVGGALSMSLGSSQKKYNSSWFTQFKVLSHRSLKNSRSAIFTPLNIVKSVALGVMSGLLWFQMPYTERTAVDRSSFFFFTMTFWVFDAMFGALFAFPSERAIIFKVRVRMSSIQHCHKNFQCYVSHLQSFYLLSNSFIFLCTILIL